MEWIADPTAWAGLFTLIVLEIVLGIDNLIFITILSDKLQKNQREKARIVGLSLALLMRLLLLSLISWVATLTRPLFSLADIVFSGRQLIMLIGGIFLLYKATVELNERLESNNEHNGQDQKRAANFWPVVAQIVVLDAVFSLDSVITAVGMVQHLTIMMIAVSIAIIIMMLASKPLAQFVNTHPTIIILCLSFLLMIGFSLVADGLGFEIPKSYLYAAIGFSIMIETFNQIANFNSKKYLLSNKSFRQRTAEAVLSLLNVKNQEKQDNELNTTEIDMSKNTDTFNQQEMQMIKRVLGLAQRSVSSIMTSRLDIDQLNLDDDKETLIQQLRQNQHTRLIVTNNSADDEPIGIIPVNELLQSELSTEKSDLYKLVKQPVIFPENASLLVALEQFKQAKTHFAFVVDEFGSVQGIVTLTDIMETIAGDLPLEGEDIDARRDIQKQDGFLIANGSIAIDDLVNYITIPTEEKREYHTLAGLIMEHLQHIPDVNEQVQIDNWIFEILEMDSNRIVKVKIYTVEQQGSLSYKDNE